MRWFTQIPPLGRARLRWRCYCAKIPAASKCSPGNSADSNVSVTPYVAAGLAAIIYVAHLGQAKADAGTGYELTAITAVVLGGAAITGGVGTIGGTLLGLLAMVVLQNGLRLAALPAELAGILTGLLLVGALALGKASGVGLRTSGNFADSGVRSPES